MAELSTKKRNKLDNSIFGIPELRKYPLNDKEHVIKAIQFFHHCPVEYKKELAYNINKAAKKYNITLSKDTPIYDYLNEIYQVDIDLLEDISDLENNYFNNLYILNETMWKEEDAKAVVDGVIKCWNERFKLVKSPKDKQKLVADIQMEKSALNRMQAANDFNGILDRAKMNVNKMGKQLAAGKNARSRKGGTAAGKGLGVGNAMIAGGAVLGGVLGGAKGKAKATKKNNGKIKTTLRVGTGAAAGMAAGTALGATLGAANIGRKAFSDQVGNGKAQDPNKPLRQYGEKYVSFVNDFQQQVIRMNPNGQNNEEGGEQ